MLARDGKIIRREELGLWESGQEALKNAHAEAEAIIEKAHTEAQKTKERGYINGVREARNEQSQLIIDAVIRRDLYLSSIEADLADVVANAMQKIVSDLDHNTLARAAVEQALRELKNQNVATILVHPDQYDYMNGLCQELINRHPPLNTLRVETDSRVKSGACILSSDQGIIESDPEQQLQVLKAAVRKTVGPHAAEPSDLVASENPPANSKP